MDVHELDYELPDELIAQRPPESRDAARLLVLDRDRGAVAHRAVRDLPSLLRPVLFVVNDTRVIPARLLGNKPTGGKVELLLVERLSAPGPTERWIAMGRASKPLRQGTEVLVSDELRAVVVARGEARLEVDLHARTTVTEALDRVGRVPLPPYIRRGDEPDDRERYQTVFASNAGAVAAPTAGLHFSQALVTALEEAGHRFARVTLHVGPGTFRPVESERLEDHPMHRERYVISHPASAAIEAARAEGRPVIAVGTTVVRTLEAAFDGARVPAGEGSTDLFIRPPHHFGIVDGLLTNFHLPRSTLLALVMAFAGVEPVRRAYAEAVRARYRFFSYGDAMLIVDERVRP